MKHKPKKVTLELAYDDDTPEEWRALTAFVGRTNWKVTKVK